MEEIEEQEKSKKVKKASSITSLEENVAIQKEKVSDLTEEHTLWARILGLIISPDHHGSGKSSSESWVSFFERLLGQPIRGVPLKFQVPADHPIDFEDVVVEVSTHIASLKSMLSKHKAIYENKQKTLENRQQRHKRIEERERAKVEKILDMRATGKDKEVKEKKKILGLL